MEQRAFFGWSKDFFRYHYFISTLRINSLRWYHISCFFLKWPMSIEKKKIRCLWGALGMKKICSIFVLFRCRCISEHRHKNVSPDIYNGFLLLFVWHYTTLSKAQTATSWPGVLRSFSIKMDKKEWWQLGNCRARPACHYWQRISADMEAEDREKLCCTGEKKKVEYNRMCRGS